VVAVDPGEQARSLAPANACNLWLLHDGSIAQDRFPTMDWAEGAAKEATPTTPA
jgi:hypothetical protein